MGDRVARQGPGRQDQGRRRGPQVLQPLGQGLGRRQARVLQDLPARRASAQSHPEHRKGDPPQGSTGRPRRQARRHPAVRRKTHPRPARGRTDRFQGRRLFRPARVGPVGLLHQRQRPQGAGDLACRLARQGAGGHRSAQGQQGPGRYRRRHHDRDQDAEQVAVRRRHARRRHLGDGSAEIRRGSRGQRVRRSGHAPDSARLEEAAEPGDDLAGGSTQSGDDPGGAQELQRQDGLRQERRLRRRRRRPRGRRYATVALGGLLSRPDRARVPAGSGEPARDQPGGQRRGRADQREQPVEAHLADRGGRRRRRRP